MISKKTIILVAIHRFTHFGITKTTFEDLAYDLSIPSGSIFKHYAKKELLILSVMDYLMTKYFKCMLRAMSTSKTPQENTFSLFEARYLFLKKYWRLYLTLKSSLKADNYQKIEIAYQKTREKLFLTFQEQFTKENEKAGYQCTRDLIGHLDEGLQLFFETAQQKLSRGYNDLDEIRVKQFALLSAELGVS